MSKIKLNVKFYNPNTEDEMAKVIARLLVKNIAEKAAEGLQGKNRSIPEPRRENR